MTRFLSRLSAKATQRRPPQPRPSAQARSSGGNTVQAGVRSRRERSGESPSLWDVNPEHVVPITGLALPSEVQQPSAALQDEGAKEDVSLPLLHVSVCR